MEEVWKDVVGFEEYLKVSNLGRVWSKRTNRVLKHFVTKSGYASISTRFGSRSAKNHCFRVHRLVCQAFLPNPEGKPQVNHLNSDRLDNRLCNLEWATAKENADHSYEYGNASRDKPNYLTRTLSDAEVRYIRTNYRPLDRNFGSRALARKFDLAHTIILKVINKVTYKDIT